MADRKTTDVERHYTEGRRYPRGQNRDTGSQRRVRHEPEMTARNQEEPQMPEDQRDHRGGRYFNDVPVDNWLRGGGQQGAGKPSFDDKANAWRRPDKGDDWGSGHDPAIIRKPGPNTPNR